MKVPAAGSLLAILAAIPDYRGRKGRRHSLAAMLAAIICGLLTGAKGCTAIAQWLHDQEPEFWHSIGFLRKPPTSNCFRDVLLGLPPETLENAVRSWVTEYLAAVPGELGPVALDGKTLRGTLQPHGQSIHLLAMFDAATGGVIAQARMPGHTNEHKAAMRLLRSVVLKGRLVTGDAMFCQRDICREITDSGGDYLVAVKDNQPELKETIESEFRSGRSPLQRTRSATAA
ncbi:ISAs1 family transposase [Rosistilla oblonga]|uniref:ISAs1 family transposase n=3 Tax=Rosistilla oblonga TaxID=2527990 RepID=UPI003A97EF86